MVNHFVLSDEELVDRFLDFVEEHTYVDDSWIYSDDDEPEVIYAAKRHSEYWEIRKELLERMKK